MGCDVGAALPRVVVETEQKFLVNREAFEAVRGSLGRRHIRQCYVAVQENNDGWEVRFRETMSRGMPQYHQTLKRRRPDSVIARDEIEFPVSALNFDAVWSASSWRVEKDRYDGAAVGDWTIDVFTSGPLQGVAVAELELPEGYSSVGQYLALQPLAQQQWPSWLSRNSDGAAYGYSALLGGGMVCLTTERVNLVAAGVVKKSERLRRILGAVAAAEMTALAQATGQYADDFPKYVKRPATPKLTRQGVRDLGYSKRGGVL